MLLDKSLSTILSSFSSCCLTRHFTLQMIQLMCCQSESNTPPSGEEWITQSYLRLHVCMCSESLQWLVVGNQLYQVVKFHRGVKQGSVLYPMLLLLVMDPPCQSGECRGRSLYQWYLYGVTLPHWWFTECYAKSVAFRKAGWYHWES